MDAICESDSDRLPGAIFGFETPSTDSQVVPFFFHEDPGGIYTRTPPDMHPFLTWGLVAASLTVFFLGENSDYV